MSRATASNGLYTLAFGVDHTPMGCFIQLWEKAAEGENAEWDDMDGPQIDMDEMWGLKIHNKKTLERSPNLNKVLQDGKIDKPLLRQALHSQEFIIDIGLACGLDIRKKVYELWD